MHIGLTTYATDQSIAPGAFAQAAEERGFESLFLPEHTHIPVSRATPFPSGGDLPEWYARGLDPFVALAAAAATTTKLRLGTAVCLVVERDPITLAKEVASLDHLSGGRFLFGIGGGWNREEMLNHGTEPSTRWRLLRERVEAMRAIWADDVAEFHGEFVSFDPIWSWPKPVQRPGPPVLIGGVGRQAIERVVEYGDGWIPPMGWIDELPVAVAALRRLEADRDVCPRPITVVGVKPKADVIGRLAQMGVARAVIAVPPGDADRVLPLLDRYALLLGEPVQ